MKIGIITFHFPYNCGAVLQCFALQIKLEELGHDVEIINYRPWYHQNRYTALKNPLYFAQKRFHEPADNAFKKSWHAIDGFLKTIYSWRKYPQVAPKDRRFKEFAKKNLKETRVYRSLRQLQNDPPACKLYIAGSDQLWNTSLTGGEFDNAYFLDFGNSEIGRMSYSVGADFTKLDYPENILKDLLRRLDIISLREVKWKPTIEAAVDRKKTVHIDLDPTLLLEKEAYLKYMPQMPEEREPYILTYTMGGETQKQIYNGARILSAKLGMRVIDVSGNPGYMNKKVEDNRLCGPDQFLWYVYHANYVITNSFHGTVFSILFQKKFVTIPHAITGNRVTELLDKLGLSSRYHKQTHQAIEEITNEIAYIDVAEKLDKLKKISVDFLQDSIHKYECRK